MLVYAYISIYKSVNERGPRVVRGAPSWRVARLIGAGGPQPPGPRAAVRAAAVGLVGQEGGPTLSVPQ